MQDKARQGRARQGRTGQGRADARQEGRDTKSESGERIFQEYVTLCYD